MTNAARLNELRQFCNTIPVPALQLKLRASPRRFQERVQALLRPGISSGELDTLLKHLCYKVATLELLQQVRALLTDRNRWWNGLHARTAELQTVSGRAESAVQWSLVAAVEKFSHEISETLQFNAWLNLQCYACDFLCPEAKPKIVRAELLNTITSTSTHEELLARIDSAITLCAAEYQLDWLLNETRPETSPH